MQTLCSFPESYHVIPTESRLDTTTVRDIPASKSTYEKESLAEKYEGPTTGAQSAWELRVQVWGVGGSRQLRDLWLAVQPAPCLDPVPTRLSPGPTDLLNKARPRPPRAPSASQLEKRKCPSQQTESPNLRTPLAQNGGPDCSGWSSLPTPSKGNKTPGVGRRILRTLRTGSE